MLEDFQVELLDPACLAEAVRELGDVLIDCVEGGASVSFMSPMTREKADRFWHDAISSQQRGERLILVARDGTGAIVGTVQVVFAQQENQPHRADVAKMLVHRTARRKGLGLALLSAAEEQAARHGKTLLVLDAVTGGSGEALYLRGGWKVVGEIPFYALYPDGRMCSTTYMYKVLGGG